jgi:hypothetical protein
MVHVGRLGDFSVRDWLEQHEAAMERLPYVLISSMDSDRLVSNMPWVTSRCGSDSKWAISRSPLVISGAALVSLLEDTSLFAGFDELWIPSRLPVANPPDDANLVAPRELDVESPPGVVRWVEDSRCRLGIGDGYGMNYVAADLELAAGLGLD